MDGTADLTSVFIPQKAPVVRYGQGELIGWNPDTFENTVRYNGQTFHNLDVKSGADALSWSTPQTVDLKIIDSSGDQGASQMVIDGRIIRPGAGNAAEAIAFMRGALAKEISAEIFAARIFSDFDAGLAERNSTTFGDPTNGADPGPEVTVDIQIGSALVVLSANMRLSTEDTLDANSPEYASVIGVEVSGATSISADTSRAINAVMWKYNNSGLTNTDGVVMALGNTYVYPITGLTPGENTFTMKYATWATATTGLQVDDRSLTVIGF